MPRSKTDFSYLPRAAGRFPQVSGLKIVVDPSRPVGQRVVSVEADGKPLEDTKIYRLATNDFMARGGDGYSMFDNVHEIIPGHDGPLMTNEVIEYLQKIEHRANRRRRADRVQTGLANKNALSRAGEGAISLSCAQVLRREAQFKACDAGEDVEADLALNAQRLQREGIVGPAIQTLAPAPTPTAAPAVTPP